MWCSHDSFLPFKKSDTMFILKGALFSFWSFLKKNFTLIRKESAIYWVESHWTKLWGCCCCCLVTSVVSDSVWSHRRQPPGSPIPGILQARTLEWVAISFSNAWKWKVKVKSLSRVWLLATPWTAAHQAPLSMEFSRQEYCSGVPLPSHSPLQMLW